MKNNIIYLMFASCLFLCVTACENEPIENPNGPTAESLLNGATLADLQLLLAGVESVMRNDIEYHYNTVSIIGREYYDLTGTDPRYTGELLGAQGAVLDNNGFLTTRSFAQVYRVVRNANNLITATNNSLAGLTDAEKGGIIGIANTLKSYSLLIELNRQYQNGVRIDVSDPDNPGAFLTYEESLAALGQLLDDSYAQINATGDAFVVNLSPGFAGLSSPSGFNKFNRALRARVSLYQNDKAAVLSNLGQSFIDPSGDLSFGAYHVFGTSGNDINNALAVVPQTTLYTATNSWLEGAENGDLRIDMKTVELIPTDDLSVPVELDGLSGSRQIALYTSLTAEVPLIRNEELILMRAEALIGSDNAGAVQMINIIRNAAGIGDYTGGTSDADLVNEVLHQRRYSLFGEGHYWVDMRRYDRLDQIPTERAGDVVHVQFPRPILEQ